MTTAVPSAALAGFLAGYRGLTREAYALDLRQFTTWCRARSLKPFAVRHVSIESFARDLQAKGARPCHHDPAAVRHRRVLQVRGRRGTPGPFPAAHVRQPRADYESRAVALDRNELGALLVTGLGPPARHGLISLLALTTCGSPRQPAPASSTST